MLRPAHILVHVQVIATIDNRPLLVVLDDLQNAREVAQLFFPIALQHSIKPLLRCFQLAEHRLLIDLEPESLAKPAITMSLVDRFMNRLYWYITLSRGLCPLSHASSFWLKASTAATNSLKLAKRL